MPPVVNWRDWREEAAAESTNSLSPNRSIVFSTSARDDPNGNAPTIRRVISAGSNPHHKYGGSLFHARDPGSGHFLSHGSRAAQPASVANTKIATTSNRTEHSKPTHLFTHPEPLVTFHSSL